MTMTNQKHQIDSQIEYSIAYTAYKTRTDLLITEALNRYFPHVHISWAHLAIHT